MKVKNLLEKRTYVINMEKDKHRLHRFYESFDTYGIRRPTRVIAVDANHPKNKKLVSSILTSGHTYLEYPTEVGCALSHWSILSKAMKEGWEWVVVFEDDVTLSPFIHQLLERDIPEDWEFIYLSHCPNHSKRNPASICPPYHSHKPIKGWFHFNSSKDTAFGMYSYAIKTSAIQKILQSFSFHVPLDYHIMKNHSLINTYGLYPCLTIHDYHYGSYSNPLRTELYPTGTSLQLVSSSIYASLLTSILGYKNINFTYLTILILLTEITRGIKKIQKMEHFKKITPNFPGIYGIDTYAPFHDKWSQKDINQLKKELESIESRNDIFPWRHTLLGITRDNKIIPWENYIYLAHPQSYNPPSSKYIKWIPYTKKDGIIHIDSYRYPYFMFKDGNIHGINIKYPDIYSDILKRIYGDDCMEVIRSPSYIDIGFMGVLGRWKVPEKYRCSIRLSDLNVDL